MRPTAALLSFLAICSLVACSQPKQATPASQGPPVVERNVAVPMRDGVMLRADIRKPSETGTFPVVIFRTPYGKSGADPGNEKVFDDAVARGYAVVIQDVRGRYASAGDFVPYENEGKDGYDTIEWAAVQPWSDGEVGTFGLSYPGAVQWLAAIERPPHLLAMVPAMTFSSVGPNFIYSGGVFESGWADWTYKNMSPDARVRAHLPGPKTYEAASREWERLGGADVIQGWLPSLDMPYLNDTAKYYYTWLKRQPYDPWWEWGNLQDKYGQVNPDTAVLNLSGWYDESYGTEGATTNYRGLLQARPGEDPRTKLLIGPWIHGVKATESTSAGDREFDPSAKINYSQVVLDWLDHYVRSIDNGVQDWPNVRAYVMGSNSWTDSETWPLPGTTKQTAYLGPAGSPEGVGTIEFAPTPSGARSFVSNPAKPVRDKFGTNSGAYDLRSLADKKDVLTFQTAPFSTDTEVVGHARGDIYVSSTAPDFDLYLKLIDVAPDGTAFNLESPGHEVVRASYRNKTAKRELIRPGKRVKLTFDNLLTGNTFKEGHRLRVYLMGSWFPANSRNLQTGKLETTSSKMRKGSIKIWYGGNHASRIELPIIPR